jgi:hypothetical protein
METYFPKDGPNAVFSSKEGYTHGCPHVIDYNPKYKMKGNHDNWRFHDTFEDTADTPWKVWWDFPGMRHGLMAVGVVVVFDQARQLLTGDSTHLHAGQSEDKKH